MIPPPPTESAVLWNNLLALIPVVNPLAGVGWKRGDTNMDRGHSVSVGGFSRASPLRATETKTLGTKRRSAGPPRASYARVLAAPHQSAQNWMSE